MYWNSGVMFKGIIKKFWLTLTWDVLKYDFSTNSAVMITININMRCIEMLAPIVVNEYIRRLTLTWDVLKFLWRPAMKSQP